MNTFLTILLVLAGIIMLFLLLALFAKDSYFLLKEISIQLPRQTVFEYVSQLKNQDHYSKYAMMDPNMKKQFHGVDGTVGFVYAWDGNKDAGQGEQKITSIQKGKRIDWDIRFIKPFSGQAKSFMLTESISENETRVKWGFSSKLKYPMNIMLLFMDMDKVVGRDLALSLSNLKNLLENGQVELKHQGQLESANI
ncbi:MAG TPA: SRPBCC family protein [Chitinophagaceae bacterium]